MEALGEWGLTKCGGGEMGERADDGNGPPHSFRVRVRRLG